MQKFKQGLEIYGLQVRQGGDSGFLGIFSHSNTADRIYILPDKNGTLATLDDVSNPVLSSASVIAALGYTPVNKAGDTIKSLTKINANSSDITGIDSGTLFQLIGTNGGQAIHEIIAAGTSSTPYVAFRHMRGTLASPTATQSGDSLGCSIFRGRAATKFTNTIGYINVVATENYTDAANGTKMVFSTTPNGTASSKAVGYWDQDGRLVANYGLAVAQSGYAGLVRQTLGNLTTGGPYQSDIKIFQDTSAIYIGVNYNNSANAFIDNRSAGPLQIMNSGSVAVSIGKDNTFTANASVTAPGFRSSITVLDLSGLDAGTWYPVTIPMADYIGRTVRMRVSAALNMGVVPSWSTHSSGYSVICDWSVNGNGWGTMATVRTIHTNTQKFANVPIVGGIGQLENGSIEFIYLRGGGKYKFESDYGVTPTLQSTTYTSYSQSVGPTTSLFNDVWSMASNNVSFCDVTSTGVFYGNGSGLIGTATGLTAGNATNISNTGTVCLGSATESNAITVTQPAYTSGKPVKLLNFNWYSNTWQLGNIRGGDTNSLGLGVFLSGVEKARFQDGSLLVGGNAVITAGSIGSQSVSYATTAGSANWSSYLTNLGAYAATDPGTTRGPSGLRLYNCYSNGYPLPYGNVLHMYGGGANQLLLGWSGSDGSHADNYVRSKRDNDSGAWSPWAKIATDANITSFGLSSTQVFNAINVANNPDWYRTSGTAGIYFSTYSAGLYASGNQYIQTYNASSLQVTGTLYSSGNIIAYYSDERLKENIKPITCALNKLLSLRGITFNANSKALELGYTDTSEQVGVIAQEVQKVLPQAVKFAPFDQEVEEDGKTFHSKSGENYLTVQYERLVPLLIEAIKELNQKIENLK